MSTCMYILVNAQHRGTVDIHVRLSYVLVYVHVGCRQRSTHAVVTVRGL